MSIKTALGGIFAKDTPFAPTPDIPRSDVQGAVRYVGEIASGGTPSTDAPSSASYIVSQSDSGLSNERVATDTATITWDFGTLGQAKANWQFLGIEDLTDPGGDRGMFWDDSAGNVAWFTAGTGMGFSGTQFSITDADLVAIVDEAGFTTGDILYHNGTTLARLGAGTDGQFLRTRGTSAAPDWQNISGGGDMLRANNLSDVTSATTARTNLGVGTGDSPQFTAINIGHASDTTLTRISAGVAAIEGSNILLASGLGSITQAYDVELAALAGLTSAADKLPYFTGSGTAGLADFTSFGRSLVDDADASTARTTLGLVIGTNVQAYDPDLTTWAGLTPSANAQSLVTAANYAAMRTLLSLVPGTDVQAYDAELAALASTTSAADALPYFTGSGTASTTTLSSFGRSLIDDAAASNARTTLGLVIGTDVQAQDAELAAIAGLTSAADRLPYFTGAGTAALATYTAFARTLDDDADAATARSTLGVTIGTNVQAWDADLDALAALSGTNNIYYRSAANTWTSVTIGGMLSFSAGTLNVGDAELSALAGLTSAADALPYFTGSGTAATTTLTTFGRSLIDDAAASNARTTLGLVIGTDVQAYDAELAAFAGLTSAADKIGYFTGSGTMSTTDFTSTARSLLDDTSTSAMRTTLGLAIGTDVQAYDAELAAFAGLTSAADKIGYFTGSGTMSTTDFTSTARSLVDDTSTSAMRTTLGLAIGTDVQAYSAQNTVRAISYVIDGGGSTISTGNKRGLRIPFACTINSVTLGADQSGSIVIDIWKDTQANYPPTVADTITASAKPTISSATKSEDTTLTGWTTSISAGDWLYFNVDSVTTIQFVTLTLKVTTT